MPIFADKPIDTPGQPWGCAEFDVWRAYQRVQRNYADVLATINALPGDAHPSNSSTMRCLTPVRSPTPVRTA